MEGQILVVDPNLPIPSGTNSSDPRNPKATIKNLMMTGAQANADAQYDPPPNREGFQSQFFTYNSIICLLIIGFIVYSLCKKCITYGLVLFGVAVILVYLERNLNRTV
jgi:hypothetical protein